MRAKIAMAAFIAATVAGTAAYGQSIPEGQSCGGLLCDMGVFGHKTAPEPKPAPSPVKAEVAPAAASAELVDREPKTKLARKKKRVAKAASKDKVAAKAASGDATSREARKKPMVTVAATRPAPVVQTPVPFGWDTAVRPTATQPQPPVLDAAPPMAQAQPVPAAPPVAQAKPPAASGSTPVNVINLYSALPSAGGIRPLY